VSGVRYVGYFGEATGYGQAARDQLLALAASGVDVGARSICVIDGATLDVAPDAHLSPDVARLAARAPAYDTVVVHTPPYGFGAAHEAGRRNIGVVAWETETLPRAWHAPVRMMDELWVPSAFSAVAFAGSVPVHVIPHPVSLRVPRERAFPGIPDDVFVFAAIFEWQDRKNPDGLVRAFRRAFAGKRDVALVLKVGLRFGGDPETLLRSLRQLISPAPWRSPPIYVLEASETSREVVTQLLARADAYVSLHRAEGFGLCMAEAMALGKPVVATGYSGNLEFMDAESAFLVDYELVPIRQRLSFWADFEAGMRWAEPRVDHAVEQLRRCAYQHEDRRRIAERGQAKVAELLAPERVGRLMRERIEGRRLDQV
jgi:glycosyltransferase involved in cell wall biosynthesis